MSTQVNLCKSKLRSSDLDVGKEDQVRRRLGQWARPIAGLLALTLALAVVAPAGAADAARPQPTLAASAKAAAASLALPGAAPRAQAKPTPAAQTNSGSSKGFFSTTTGKAALVLMAAGTSFMVYSAFHDNNAVHSQFR